MPKAMTLDEYIAAACDLRAQVGGAVQVMTWRVSGGVLPALVPQIAYTKRHVAVVGGQRKDLAQAGVFFDARYDKEDQRGELVVRVK